MHSQKLTFTFFVLALISLCFGAPTPTLISTNVLSTVPEAEAHPRTFTNGFGLFSAIDARTAYSTPIEIKTRNNKEEGEVLAERQDCGAPFCNAGTGLSAPGFSAMVMAMAVVAVGGVVMG
jgi:hypothetical protein